MKKQIWVYALGGVLILALVLGGGVALARRGDGTMNGPGLNGSGSGSTHLLPSRFRQGRR